MHPVISVVVENVARNWHLFLLATFIIASIVSTINTPVQHSLLITSISWALVWIASVLRAGIYSGGDNTTRKKFSWIAGCLLALAQICERAARDKEGIWLTKALLPALVYLISKTEIWTNAGASTAIAAHEMQSLDAQPNLEKTKHAASSRLLGIATLSAATVLTTPFITSPTSALGFCSVLFTAIGLTSFEMAISSAKDEKSNGNRGFVSANGTFSRRNSLNGAQQAHYFTSLRDVAAVVGIICGAATLLMESFRTDALIWNPKISELGGDWKLVQPPRIIEQCVLMIVEGSVEKVLLFVSLHQQGALRTSFVAVFACLYARLNSGASISGIWFTIIFASTTLLFLYHPSSSTQTMIDRRGTARAKRIVLFLAIVSYTGVFVHFSYRNITLRSVDTSTAPIIAITPPVNLYDPVPLDTKKGHPVDQLIRSAEKDFQSLLAGQSKTLADAVTEYRHRYGIPPPPQFERWFEFAQRAGVQLIDEFDTINEALLPFWALKPSTIRARVREALGSNENHLIGLMIRDGKAVKIENGPEWQQQATMGMITNFVQHLPDMDLAFNIHDEPRVVVPHDQLSRLIEIARDQTRPAAFGKDSPRNAFSKRPDDMNNGQRFDEAKTTRFNQFAHQQTWTHSRLSCSPNSPARSYDDNAADNLTSYAIGELGFVYNASAFADICNSPSLRQTYGFFERPNAFNIVHDLIPIFSQSKVSSFQDILYPSPWYWFGKVGYDEERDTTWENKTNNLYWRGSTTGGFSRNGGWRRQHRQHVVQRLNAPDKAKILINRGREDAPDWQVKEVQRRDYADLIDIKFSHVGQCDPGDCDAQKEFFDVVERVDGQDAWQHKHLLDMDGNAFSGRFYAFLKSQSLVYKMAVFQEWHKEWLMPWVHYIPLSLRGDEWLELVRYFSGEEEGKIQAPRMAMQGREWASKVLRNEDFEVWFFRLLLEYGRLIDEDREFIGYPGP
ncbi:glycosyltransferase family 90 protein [Lepidopterella palustris CBS 459.81]|uniref:Glycosyltransferase family 90 protein n=1 Tax=Lepidopterella palustris CBS 459.81 TaxID=1314670 RepID=A0A8E2EE85_9PEZI|nr:glycosyltransferase family 90 protein [Lepidopterella palustris CBS 459.81]